MYGISNDNIVDFFEKRRDEELKNNFVGVFPSNYVIKFIKFYRMMTEKRGRYPFVIMNTDRSDREGTYWRSFLDLHPKKEIFCF